MDCHTVLIREMMQNILHTTTPREDIEAVSRELANSSEFRIASASLRAKSVHDVASMPARINVDDMTFKCKEVPIVDQKDTGTCWLQAGMAFLSTLALKRGIKLRFSMPYLVFFDKLEKALVFLVAMAQPDLDERIRWHWLSDGPLTDGGTWGMFIFLIKKYGCILHDAMIPTYNSMHTTQINRYLNRYLRSAAGLIRNGQLSVMQAMQHVQDALLRTYSLPPSAIKLLEDNHGISATVTPETLLPLVVPMDCFSYVLLTHAPDRPLGRYIGPYTNDVSDPDQDLFICVEMDILVQACIDQLQQGEPIWFASDLHDFSSKRGMADVGLYNVNDLLNLPIYDSLDKAQRMKNRNTAPVHAMLFTGVKVEHGAPVMWRIQNSWGKTKNVGKGFMTVTHDWFCQHVFQVAVPSHCIPQKYLLSSSPPTRLTPWDIFATVA